MSDNVILTFGMGGWYPRGVKRMETKLATYLQNWDFKGWINEYPPGSPTHQENPYAFKAYAFKWAVDNGYKRALWLDSSVVPNKNPEPLFKKISENGYLILLNGWTNAVWSTETQLKYYGFTREQAKNVPHPIGGIIGMDFTNPIGKNMYDKFIQAADAGIFRGSWTNKKHEVSEDPTVLGSRHDQTCLGFIAYELGLEYSVHLAAYQNHGDFYFYILEAK